MIEEDKNRIVSAEENSEELAFEKTLRPQSLADYVEASGIDLVLIATHGRSGISRWVRGSIADRILRSSRAPVLMVRADGQMGGGKR